MQIQPILKAINFKNNTDYQKTMIKREKLWQQTQALDDIGTLCLLGGLLLSPDINIVVSKNKTPKIKYFDRILFWYRSYSCICSYDKKKYSCE